MAAPATFYVVRSGLPNSPMVQVAVALLRRALYADALVTASFGGFLVAVPGGVLELLGLPLVGDQAWLRLLGVAFVSLALLMVLVGHRADDLWWWSWAFVILEFGRAAVNTLQALFGVPAGASSWPWWIGAAASWAFCFALLWALARIGVERPVP